MIISVAGVAQNGDILIKGKVVNETDGNPVEYASIALYYLPDSALASGTVTDSEGQFHINNCQAGSAYLKIRFIGYETGFVSGILLNRKIRETNVGVISLKQSYLSLNEVTVDAERNTVTYKIDKKIVNLNSLTGAESGTAADALENVPGISRDAEGNIFVRGSANFTVLIDGKPSLIQGNDLLRQISASLIENIEVITNPSVKYSPDGTSGILNIIMKKEKNSGESGIVNTSASTNQKYSADFNITVKKKKWNIYFSPAFQDRTYLNKKFTELKTSSNDTSFIVTGNSKPLYRTRGFSLRTGTDYSFSEITTLSYAADIGQFTYDRIIKNKFNESNSPGQDNIYTLYQNDYGFGGFYFMNYINLQKKLKGQDHELNIMALYSMWHGTDHQNTVQYCTDDNFLVQNEISGSQMLFKNKNDKTRLRFTIDYSKPVLSDGSFQTGIMIDMSENNYDFCFTFPDTVPSDWYTDSMNSSMFSFPQNNLSGYLIYSFKILNIQIQAGIRPEYYERDLFLRNTNQHYRFSRSGFYPSLHISKDFNGDLSMQASYSRRINRPGEIMVNPLPYYIDNYYRRIGNPEVEPEYIDSYELSTQKKIKGSTVSAELYYRQTNNKINMIRTMENDIFLERPVNINKDYSLGAEISAKIQVNTWVTVSPSVEMFFYKFEGVPEGNIKGEESNVFSSRLNTRIKISSATSLQLTHYWYGSQKTANGESGASWAMHASLRQEFFKNSMSVSLQCNDIFQSEKYITAISQPGYYYNETTEFYSPSFVLGVSYNFNNYKPLPQRSNTNVPLM